MQLSEIKPNSQVRIQSFNDTDLELKLLEFGISIGSKVFIQVKAPFGGPILLETQNGMIALRKIEAQALDVELVS
jgi:Fe2+ transport system protein FeoA